MVGPAQVHAQQHVGPVLGFGTAGPRLDIQVGIVLIHLATEHAAELKALEALLQLRELGGHVGDGAFVTLLDRHLQQFGGIVQAGTQVVQRTDDVRQGCALAAQILGPLGLVPDAGVFQLALYLGQSITFVIVVKDTP